MCVTLGRITVPDLPSLHTLLPHPLNWYSTRRQSADGLVGRRAEDSSNLLLQHRYLTFLFLQILLQNRYPTHMLFQTDILPVYSSKLRFKTDILLNYSSTICYIAGILVVSSSNLCHKTDSPARILTEILVWRNHQPSIRPQQAQYSDQRLHRVLFMLVLCFLWLIPDEFFTSSLSFLRHFPFPFRHLIV